MSKSVDKQIAASEEPHPRRVVNVLLNSLGPGVGRLPGGGPPGGGGGGGPGGAVSARRAGAGAPRAGRRPALPRGGRGPLAEPAEPSQQNFAKFWYFFCDAIEVKFVKQLWQNLRRARLYRHRFLHVDIHFAASVV